jgi:hypothetical protein
MLMKWLRKMGDVQIRNIGCGRDVGFRKPVGGGFKRGDDNPLDCDLLVVDETTAAQTLLVL